jgi:hypothetical protein
MWPALLLASASFLLTGCASTTSPVAYPVECPKPAQPDPRLLAPPATPQGLPYPATDTDAVAIVTANNLSCRADRARFAELQTWLKGRSQ